MNVFVCDANDLRAGLDDIPPCKCHVCGQNTMYTDYCGAMCHTCGADIESTRHSSITLIRKRASLTIQEIASKTGFQTDQINDFENCEHGTVPDIYWHSFCSAISQHYVENPKKAHDPKMCVSCGEESDRPNLCSKCTESLFSTLSNADTAVSTNSNIPEK